MRTNTQANSRNASDLQVYFKEINETPLLSADEERELAERIETGDLLARDHLIRANLRLVVNLARGYLGKGLAIEDLIAEGNLGLMRAVEGFNKDMKVRVSTYASYWIKQSMQRAVINQGKPVRLPAYLVKQLSKWRRAFVQLSEVLGRDPTPEEVGKALRLSRKKVEIVNQAIRVNMLMRYAESSDGDENLSCAHLVDNRTQNIVDQLQENDEYTRLFERLEQLEERKATVIRMRYGLDSHPPMTLREIGDTLGLTRERIRQLEKQAMQQLIESP
ncbi:sigma-70 family RNA polymerase sigma factor [Singulisphaera acidiphila]|uniref:RNA polymerase sigma factor, sigma-70 family n=1 Tax=Singulisphaera acidiphila (strain ATCC BAA-1392 / DSM 18658 / VKM B-2454 / MOB10) TaxID=886293 RepID=L0DRC6_SINAD|nr:RNA polymerase sigma factor RpoD/SigA [Singulisphaera acidiphila]AGA31578.1 RNA polymerase sigma factor, sigma-70 family [Singulisphaera acidiphila DSM 18658]